jgi:hypothetical protein
MNDVLYSSIIPRWLSELHDYEPKLISLSGTINPNDKKYRMVQMTNYKLKGIAYEPRSVELDITDVDSVEEAQTMATQELLQTHPELESVEWVAVNAND